MTEHPIAPIIPDPEAIIQPPTFRRCECGEVTLNCDSVCDTCDAQWHDEFGRLSPDIPTAYSRCGDPTCPFCVFEGFDE